MSTKSPSVAFDRVSSADQREGFSLDAQEKLSEKYSKENNLIIVKRWSVNESASKENDRKFFFEMFDYIKEYDIQHVIFDKVDRACRGLKSAQMIEELIEKRGVRFHFTRDGLVVDANSQSSEKLRFYLHVILAKYYIDNLKGEIKKGMDEREESGFWNYKAPIGYKNVRVDADGNVTHDKHGKAIIQMDEPTATHVRELFELYATGNYGYKDLTKFLNNRLENRKVVMSCVETLLVNPFYYGAMRVRGTIVPGKHPALISKTLWGACQKIKGIRGEDHQVRNANWVPKPFMGLLKCGVCGHGVTGEIKRKASGKTYVYYHCANRDCPERRRNVPQDKIEEQLIHAFVPFSKFTPNATRAFIDAIHGSMGELEIYTQREMAKLADRRLEVKKQMEKVENFRRQGVLSEQEYSELMAMKQKSIEENEVEIQAAIKANGDTFNAGMTIIELLNKSNDFMKLSQNQLEKARLSKLVLSNPILKDGTIYFSYQKPFDVLIELTSKKNWWR